MQAALDQHEYGLSFAQHAVWYMLQHFPKRTNNVLSVCGRVESMIDKDCMRAAVGDLLARHPGLRATFKTKIGAGMHGFAEGARHGVEEKEKV